MTETFALFPPNGLDRSLHTAVLIGLAFGTFFTETFGWTFAGLVVPGYLAAVFFAAPVTAAFIVFEAITTYLFVALIARWITKTGVWSTAFGRERFYLFIVGAVAVRLLLEGAAVPALAETYGFAHSRELYSIGLVLVPLLANAFWNSGLFRAAPRLAVLTGLTALALLVLLRTTNLSVSRFQVLNESLSLEFLETPKAHVILVVGALLGARNNVRYGWDYNGILVPGLLAVAWYEPTKLLTTTVEALVVYWLSRGITSVRPFSRMLLVGPRRMLFVYVVGFVAKMALGFAMARFAPGVQMIDYFGFGYLLPSLLAVKMWNKEHVGIVIMPTLQVSLVAFLLGNGLGYAAVALGSGGPPGAEVVTPAEAPRVGSAALALVLADTVPRPGPKPRPGALSADVAARRIAHRVAREVLAEGAPRDETLRAAVNARVSLVREEPPAGEPDAPPEGAWLVVGSRLDDAEEAPSTPRAAFRRRAGTAGWLVLVEPPDAGSALPAAALRIGETLGAAGVVLLSRHAAIRQHDEAFAAAMADAMEGPGVLRVEPGLGAGPVLSVVGSPGALPVAALGRALGAEITLVFRAARGGGGRFDDAPRLSLPGAVAEAVGAARLGAPDVLRWPRSMLDELQSRMLSLTSVEPGRFRPPSIEELRLFDAVIAPRLVVSAMRSGLAAAGGPPSAWERAVLGRLGYRSVHIGGEGRAELAWGMVEPGPEDGGGERRGNPTWIVLADVAPGEEPAAAAKAGEEAPPLLVEVPAPRWQVGTFGAAVTISEALGARALLLAGSLPTDDPGGAADVRRREGLRSFFQRGHELWIGGGGSALSVQGIEADRSGERDVVISFGREAPRPEHVPPFARPLVQTLRDLELRVGLFDGRREQVPFSGAVDAGMAYAKRFAEGRFGILYLGSAMRDFFELRRFQGAGEDVAAPGSVLSLPLLEMRLEQRLQRSQVAPALVDVAERALYLASCAPRQGEANARCPTARAQAGCDVDASVEGFRRYAVERNPYDLQAQLARVREGATGGCYVELARDESSGRPWAIAARPGEALLLPIDGALVARAGPALGAPERLRRAIVVGTSALRVSGAPEEAAP